jgi:hypothetical protein
VKLFPAFAVILAGCYHTSEWGGTGDYRAHNSHVGERLVDSEQVARFDETNGIRAIVEKRGLCHPTLVGDHFEEKQEQTKRLAGKGWLVAGSLILGAAGAFGVLFAAADENNQDLFGNPLPPHYSDSFHNTMYVAGGIAVAAAIGGIAAAIYLPETRRHDRWVPVEGDPHELVTSDEPLPCKAAAAPAPDVTVHVEAKFEKGTSLAWDIKTDATGSAPVELAPVRIVAGWCGEAIIVATVLDQTWHGTTAGNRVPLEQIADTRLRDLAASCAPATQSQ